MNNLAISPYIGMHALQIQNVKREVVKKVSISELNPPYPPLKKVEPNQPLVKVEPNEESKTVPLGEPNINLPGEPEPFLANSSETVSVLAKTDL
jgi:hypothetical protein